MVEPPRTPDKLNLGSGRDYLDGWVNLDITADTKPDIVHDLDVIPWPFESDQFARVKLFDVLEHLHRPLGALVELHRICAPGARVDIVVPHFSSCNAYTDITHRTCFGYFSLDTVTGAHAHDYYTQIRYRMVRRAIEFYKTPVGKIASRLANRRPVGYERRWAWIFPAWFIVFELEVLK
jgi:SAM-dependent methyltransferase